MSAISMLKYKGRKYQDINTAKETLTTRGNEKKLAKDGKAMNMINKGERTEREKSDGRDIAKL